MFFTPQLVTVVTKIIDTLPQHTRINSSKHTKPRNIYRRSVAATKTRQDKLLAKKQQKIFAEMALTFFIQNSHLVRGLPRPGDDFADPTHRLGVRGHGADCSDVVHNVLGGDGLPPAVHCVKVEPNAACCDTMSSYIWSVYTITECCVLHA